MSDSRHLLHRRAAIIASRAGDVMANNAGLMRAEHVLTARTGANRGRRHVVGNQWRAYSRARDHIERITTPHERRRGETGEQLVDETRLRGGAEGGGSTRGSWATQ